MTFAQSFDGIPVFDGTVSVHIDSTGEVVRVTSSAARGEGRVRAPKLTAEDAATVAAGDVAPGAPFAPVRVGSSTGSGVARFARGSFLQDVTTSLVWFAMDGGARLAWHVELEPDGVPQFYDVLVDAETGELLLRRNRVLDANGTGRVVQSTSTQAIDPRLPDAMPVGAAACPPPTNHEVRDLTAPFRDPATVLSDSGLLSGNNVHVFRGDTVTEGALGTFDGTNWSFDFPFNSAESAETALFFALNFAHDFFYDLGFDEAAGNFQANNFARGGVGGDPIAAIARAGGRNNASFQKAREGSSPIIRMFLWDGTGCWSEDVDGDGLQDIDGDFDTDIVLHEFHHGVSHRLNTSFNGNEAGAIGEGGSDFFAYSINNNTLLAEYARPGGLRSVNDKTYNDWTCANGFFCEVHDNGEIWVNVLWDIRERFRVDLVRGSEAAAINESHQLYIDGLKLSPPLPTMLDLRDAMLQADALRNPGSPQSANFCALWESFAARAMGVNATDTADNGFNRVGANFDVPAGCNAVPGLPPVTLSVSDATATEAGTTSGVFTISRQEASDTAVVNFTLTGTAARGTDYVSSPLTATIPAGALSVDVPIVPIDDAALEPNETVIMTLRSGPGYIVGTPSVGTVTIVSEDVAPDFTVTALTVPAIGGAGLTLTVSDTTKNQGTGASGASTTLFYLSVDAAINAGDSIIGTRPVPGLAIGASDTATTTLTVPETTGSGSFWVIAKADGLEVISESGETNNTRIALVRIGPDLTVSALTAPASAGPGTSILVSDTTKNVGAGAATASSSTRFYLSANFTIDSGDYALEAHGVGPLAPDGSTATTTTVTIPMDVPTGTFYLYAVSDDGNAITEPLETNNTRFVMLRVGPDLFISAMTAPTRASAGATIAVTDTTKNIGGGGAGSSTIGFYLSANLTLDAGDFRVAGTRAVGPLDAGASSLGTTTLVLPAVLPGTWFLMANADDTYTVAETQEINNVRYTTVYIGPDLSVSTMNAPVSVVAGTTMTITDTVRNYGVDPAAPSTTRYYLSLNGALDASDIQLDAERTVPALGVNGFSTGSVTVHVPTGISGSYFLLAVADAAGVVAESSELNNVGLRLMTINP